MFKKEKNTTASDTKARIGTLIGEGAIFEGNLKASETIRIDGMVNGNCTCEQQLILGPSGQIKGNITAQNIIISGKVDGDISAGGKLELLSTGKLNGNIVAKSLVIDEGACFDGRCTMTSNAALSGNTASSTVQGSGADKYSDYDE